MIKPHRLSITQLRLRNIDIPGSLRLIPVFRQFNSRPSAENSRLRRQQEFASNSLIGLPKIQNLAGTEQRFPG